MPAKQLAVFLLKGASTMVLLLRLDILHHGIGYGAFSVSPSQLE